MIIRICGLCLLLGACSQPMSAPAQKQAIENCHAYGLEAEVQREYSGSTTFHPNPGPVVDITCAPKEY